MTLDEYLESIGWDGTADKFGRSAQSVRHDIGAYGIDGGNFGVDEGDAEQYFSNLLPSMPSTPPAGNGMQDNGTQYTGAQLDTIQAPVGNAGGGATPEVFDYEGFRALLSELAGQANAPREAMTPTGVMISPVQPSQYMSNEMRDRVGRSVDYGLPASREPLDFSQFSGPRSRPASVRPAAGRRRNY